MNVNERLESLRVVCVASSGQHGLLLRGHSRVFFHKLGYVVKQVLNSASLELWNVAGCDHGILKLNKPNEQHNTKLGVVLHLKKVSQETKCRWMLLLTHNNSKVHRKFIFLNLLRLSY